FRTKRGEGFSDSNLTLARRIDRDYVDVNLLDNVVIHGAEGSIAYEGRVQGVPRSLSSSHSLTMQAVGWMAHTRDRKMSEIYVDRDLSRWGTTSAARRLAVAADLQGSFTVLPDAATGLPGLELAADGPWTTGMLTEAVYD